MDEIKIFKSNEKSSIRFGYPNQKGRGLIESWKDKYFSNAKTNINYLACIKISFEEKIRSEKFKDDSIEWIYFLWLLK